MKGNCWMGCGKDFETTEKHQNNNICPKCLKKMNDNKDIIKK